MSQPARGQPTIRRTVARDGTVTLQHASMVFRVTATELRCIPYDWSGRQPEMRWPREQIARVWVEPTASARGESMARLGLELRDGPKVELIRRAPRQALDVLEQQLSEALTAARP